MLSRSITAKRRNGACTAPDRTADVAEEPLGRLCNVYNAERMARAFAVYFQPESPKAASWRDVSERLQGGREGPAAARSAAGAAPARKLGVARSRGPD